MEEFIILCDHDYKWCVKFKEQFKESNIIVKEADCMEDALTLIHDRDKLLGADFVIVCSLYELQDYLESIQSEDSSKRNINNNPHSADALRRRNREQNLNFACDKGCFVTPAKQRAVLAKANMCKKPDICFLHTIFTDNKISDWEIPVCVITEHQSYEEELRVLKSGVQEYQYRKQPVEIIAQRVMRLFSRQHIQKQKSIYHQLPYLTSKEEAVLKLLFSHQNEIVSKEYIIQNVWEKGTYVNVRSLDTILKQIRKKLKGSPIQIETYYAKGVQLIICESHSIQ